MKKFYLLMMFALLGMVANAAEVVTTSTFVKGSSGVNINSDNLTWTIDKELGYLGFDGSKGVQLGSGSDPVMDGVTLQTAETFNNVKKIEVFLSVAKDGSASISSYVGDVQMGVTTDFSNKVPEVYTFEGGPVSGNISFVLNSKVKKAMYVQKVVIYSEEADPTQVATPTFSVESGEIYPDTEIAINCATEGAKIKYRLDEDPTVLDYSAPLVFTEIGKTVTVTAWAEAEGLEASEQAVATYNVVEKPASTDFVKVTDLSQLKDGDKVIIACESKNTILAAPDDDVRGYVEFGLSESFTLPGTSGASILTLGIENGQYTFFDGTYYLALTSDGNKLHSVEMIGENKQEYWTIDINAGETTITSVAYSGRSMKYNASAPRFACYEKGQESVSIYREPNGSSSVNDAVANEFKAVAVANGIEVNVAEAGLVSVYNAAGQLVANVNVAEGATTINVAGGFYIVKAGNTVAKVLVK